MGGYVGSAEDARRIRRQEEQREQEKAKYEAAKKQSNANVDSAGLRKFDTGTSEVCAHHGAAVLLAVARHVPRTCPCVERTAHHPVAADDQPEGLPWL